MQQPNVFLALRHIAVDLVRIHVSSVGAAKWSGEYFSEFSGLDLSPNARKQLDETFGRRRGAILQQDPTTAHRPEPKLFFPFGHSAHSIVRTNGVRVWPATRNK